MIVVTGAAGFISSCLIAKLNAKGFTNLILVDDFTHERKKPNWQHKQYLKIIERNKFIDWFTQNASQVTFVYHLGARTDTTEFDASIFDELNVAYSKSIWQICAQHAIKLVYASSAATYGMGEHGFVDSHDIISELKPLNPYGDSKNNFDIWALQQTKQPPFWAGLKFFNVYGPNEYHKGRMASVIMHAFNQISEKGSMKLFRSHNPEFKDGEQKRDFIYVKDLVNVCYFLMSKKVDNGLYNLGSGHARTFKDLALSVFAALNKTADIDFIDTPIDIRDKYQYFTEADMSKLINAGYGKPFTSLEEGTKDYVQHYLMEKKYL